MPRATRLGARVLVRGKDGIESLGLGTYVGITEARVDPIGTYPTSVILLDSGKVVYGYECLWEEVEAVPAPPMELVLSTKTRIFRAFCFCYLSRSDIVIP